MYVVTHIVLGMLVGLFFGLIQPEDLKLLVLMGAVSGLIPDVDLIPLVRRLLEKIFPNVEIEHRSITHSTKALAFGVMFVMGYALIRGFALGPVFTVLVSWASHDFTDFSFTDAPYYGWSGSDYRIGRFISLSHLELRAVDVIAVVIGIVLVWGVYFA